MNNDPLARLAAVNPVPGSLPPLAADLEQIKHARPPRAQESAAADHRRPRRLILTVPILAVICVAALLTALASIHDPQRSVTRPGTVSASRPEFIDLTRVLDVFGVPSAAYRAACQGARPLALCTLRIESSQVRSVAAGGGYTAVIEPVDVTRTTQLAHRGQAIVLALHGPTLGPIQPSAPTTLQAIRRHGLLVSTFTTLGQNRGAVLVPNGVAHVTLTRLHVQGTRGPGSAVVISSSRVAHNISVLHLSDVTDQHLKPRISALKRYFISSTGRPCHADLAVYALPATAQMTWKNANGRLIRTTPISLRINVGITNPPQNTVSQSPRCTQPK